MTVAEFEAIDLPQGWFKNQPEKQMQMLVSLQDRREN
jgi:hypothetical protein